MNHQIYGKWKGFISLPFRNSANYEWMSQQNWASPRRNTFVLSASFHFEIWLPCQSMFQSMRLIIPKQFENRMQRAWWACKPEWHEKDIFLELMSIIIIIFHCTWMFCFWGFQGKFWIVWNILWPGAGVYEYTVPTLSPEKNSLIYLRPIMTLKRSRR